MKGLDLPVPTGQASGGSVAALPARWGAEEAPSASGRPTIGPGAFFGGGGSVPTDNRPYNPPDPDPQQHDWRPAFPG